MLAICAVVVMLQFAAPVLLPVVLSVLLFYALDPVVDYIEAWRVPRALAATVVVLGFIGALGGSAMLLWGQIEAVVTKIPAGAAQLRSTFRQQRAARRQFDTGKGPGRRQRARLGRRGGGPADCRTRPV